ADLEPATRGEGEVARAAQDVRPHRQRSGDAAEDIDGRVPAERDARRVADGEIVVGGERGRRRLGAGAVVFDRAAGDGVGVRAGREGPRDLDAAARGQRAGAGTTAGQAVVGGGRDGLRTRAAELDRAAGDRVDVRARRE